MPLALVLSSYVAAARIGGGAQQLAFAAFGIDPVLIPTVVFGKSPPKGGRGRATDPADFANWLADAESEGVFGLADVVVTGHFSHPEQVALAVATIGKVRGAARTGAFSPRPIVVVDPVLGDDPRGLYVKPEVAAAVVRDLVPLADWITPNAWELKHITGLDFLDALGAAAAMRALPVKSLVTSIPVGEGRIGIACHDGEGVKLFTHPRLASAPNGTGDLVTAVFAAGMIHGRTPMMAAEYATRAAFDTVWCALEWNAPELPIVAMGDRLARPTATVKTEAIG